MTVHPRLRLAGLLVIVAIGVLLQVALALGGARHWLLTSLKAPEEILPSRVTEILEPSGDLPWIVRVEPGQQYSLEGVVYGAGQFVAVGSGGVVVASPDGIFWTRAATLPVRLLYAVTYADDQFVAVGADGVIYTAHDPTNWVQRDSGTDHWQYGVTYGNGQFVTASEGRPLLSSDGIHWTAAPTGAAFRSIFWDGGQFFGVGADHRLAVSRDGQTFEFASVTRSLYRTRRETGWEHVLNSVSRGPERYVMVGGLEQEGFIFVSEDGVQWRRHLWLGDAMYRVAYLDGQFVAVGRSWAATSPDGLDWTTFRIPAGTRGSPANLNDIAWGNGRMVAVGGGGLILSRE